MKSFVHSQQRRPAVAVTSATAAGPTPPGRTTAARLEGLEPRWEGVDRLTLVIHVLSIEVGWLVGKGGVIAEQILETLARPGGPGLALRVGVEVVA